MVFNHHHHRQLCTVKYSLSRKMLRAKRTFWERFVLHINLELSQRHTHKGDLCVLGDQRHDQKEFVWTLHKSRDDWESKIKWPNNNDNNNNIWQEIKWSNNNGKNNNIWQEIKRPNNNNNDKNNNIWQQETWVTKQQWQKQQHLTRDKVTKQQWQEEIKQPKKNKDSNNHIWRRQRRRRRRRMKLKHIIGISWVAVAEPACMWDSQARVATMLSLDKYWRIKF